MYERSMPRVARLASRSATGPRQAYRMLDRRAALSADAYVANSHVVADRIRRFYGIEPAATAYPPVDPSFTYQPEVLRGGDYLWVGRIVEPYKRLEPLIEAFRMRPDRRLVVMGDGRDKDRLQATAPTNVRFHGQVTTALLARAYSRARAVIFPSEDDFGLVPVEAMSAGTPVVALQKGGPKETVKEGRTGVFFSEAEPQLIVAAIDRFEREEWDSEDIASYAQENFGREVFVRQVREVLDAVA
ncbi:hypothetical protein BJF86_02490 [Serinicoccus sp. CNJ-927]|nr:hypothetical protein BJF86_02490 [Serinicoccus sp. CNJ-927]